MKNRQAAHRSVDNVGKAFVAVQSKRAPKVFQIGCELCRPVNEVFLKRALRQVIEQFPFFQVELENGFFWPRLTKSSREPVVTPRVLPQCGQLHGKKRPGLLYEVTYGGSWVYLAIFHGLTDGMGAACFLRMLVTAYLVIEHGGRAEDVLLVQAVGLSPRGHGADGYETHYAKKQSGKTGLPRPCFAHQVKAPLLKTNANWDCRVVVGTQAVRAVCHRLGATVTEFLTAVYINAIYNAAGPGAVHRPVAIAVPVNLREIFGCHTAKNFFAMVQTRHTAAQGAVSFYEILGQVQQDFARQLTPNSLRQNFSRYISVEKSILRFVPLAFKTLFLRFSGWLSSKSSTAVFSNLGMVALPEEFAGHIKGFDFMDKTEGIKLCVVSYKGEMSLHFTSALATCTVEGAFLKILEEWGIPIPTQPGGLAAGAAPLILKKKAVGAV
ncbi:MAG: hypothetical protein ACK5L3_14180 [Oscillospiraceae bacterium]